MKHKRWLIGALVAVLLLLGAYYNFNMRWLDFGTGDRLAYWSVPRAALLGHGFYDMEWLRAVQVSHGYDPALLGWVNYPVMLIWSPAPVYLWLLPLSALPFGVSTLVWIALSTLLYAHAAWLYNQTLASPLPPALVLALPFLLLPFFSAMNWGQIGPLLGAFLIYVWIALRRNHQVAAGFLLIPLLLKPHLLIVAALLLAVSVWNRRQWRVLVTGGASILLLLLLSYALDPHWLAGWLGQGTPNRWPSVGLFDIARAVSHLPASYRLLGVPVATAFALWRYRHVRVATPHQLGEATLASIFFGPYVWLHDLSVLLPAALWMAGVFWSHNRLRPLLLLLIGVNGWTIVRHDGVGAAAAMAPYLLYCSLFVLFWVIAARWHHRTVPRAVAALRSVPQKEQVL